MNVEAKDECAEQINMLWNSKFGGSLFYTKSIILKEIEYIHNNEECTQQRYIKTIDDWNNAFHILKENHGQIFLIAYGYDIEKSKSFQKENSDLKDKILFLSENRMLFKTITGLSDAMEVFEDLDFKGDYSENGKLKYYNFESFSSLPQQHNDPVFNKCLEMDNPELWKLFLEVYKKGVTQELWNDIKNFVIDKYGMETIWQRCIGIYNTRNGFLNFNDHPIPSVFDIKNAFIMSKEEFNSYLENLRSANKCA